MEEGAEGVEEGGGVHDEGGVLFEEEEDGELERGREVFSGERVEGEGEDRGVGGEVAGSAGRDVRGEVVDEGFPFLRAEIWEVRLLLQRRRQQRPGGGLPLHLTMRDWGANYCRFT